jgi:hypothetical protein
MLQRLGSAGFLFDMRPPERRLLYPGAIVLESGSREAPDSERPRWYPTSWATMALSLIYPHLQGSVRDAQVEADKEKG